MGRKARQVEEAPGAGAGERWEARPRSGGGIYLAGGRQIGGFVYGGTIARATASERALIAAQAPLMYEALLDLVSWLRQDGAIVQSDGRPFAGHRVGCGCGICQAVLALALAEGGGRCVLCGCTQDDGCAIGCAWEPSTGELLCTAHPPKVLEAARRFIARGCHDGPEHVSKPIARVLSKLDPASPPPTARAGKPGAAATRALPSPVSRSEGGEP